MGTFVHGDVTYLHVRRYGSGADELFIPSIAIKRIVPKHVYLDIAPEGLLAQPWHERPGAMEHRQAESPDVSDEVSTRQQSPTQSRPALALAIALDDEIGLLHQGESWQRGDRNAKTLANKPSMRVILTVLKAGARLHRHQTSAPITIHVLRGHLRVLASDESIDCPPGHLVMLEAGVPHEVEAIDEAAFLLTVGHPGYAPQSGR
jgi:quercetin dioxygenase-like cupin family protein